MSVDSINMTDAKEAVAKANEESAAQPIPTAGPSTAGLWSPKKSAVEREKLPERPIVAKDTIITSTTRAKSPQRPIVPLDTIITSAPRIVTCPLRTGLQRIDVESFMGEHLLADRALAIRCMVGAWASMLNLGRKGEAGKLWEMGKTAFGEDDWELAVDQCLKFRGRSGDNESEDGYSMPVSEK